MTNLRCMMKQDFLSHGISAGDGDEWERTKAVREINQPNVSLSVVGDIIVVDAFEL